MHIRDFRLQYVTPYLELHGRDARFILCGIYLHMFHKKIKKKFL